MSRWLWICPILAVLLSVVVLYYFGLTWKTAAVVVLVMVCPAIMIWGAFEIRKPPSRRAGRRPHR